MQYPKLKELPSSRKIVDTFRGYNHNMRISDGEFFDMENMTSDYYPILSPRKKRGIYASPGAPGGLIEKDGLCYVDGADFVINGYRVAMGLSEDCPKQLVSMGAYVIILPDKKYINTADISEFGDIEAEFEATGDVTFSVCREDGGEYTAEYIQPEEPANPENMSLWIDTSAERHTLKQYSAASGVWVSIATTYIKISSTGIGSAFDRYDGITISGVIPEELQDLNATMTIHNCADNWIVVLGFLDRVMTQTAEEGTVRVSRQMPNMDFVVESENRLWGCRYGTALDGRVVNEIYASKLGDFKNWNCFMGISTDSYAASVGTDGPFTGAVTHMGHPLFFKENCVHKVYGNYPANFQIQTTACRGVQKGCSRSLAIVNETLFYKAGSGVMAYDGSLPVEASYALGNVYYSEAVAGSHGSKYYISMKDGSQKWNLFVYDVAKSLWHREDSFRAECFCSCGAQMYAIDHDTRNIVALLGGGDEDCRPVKWMVQTGPIGTDMPDMKYISRLTLRMSMEIGTKVRIYVQYDSLGGWDHLCTMTGTNLRSFSIPIRPRRCDHLRLRIEGEGDARIYSLTKTTEQGSDIS